MRLAAIVALAALACSAATAILVACSSSYSEAGASADASSPDAAAVDDATVVVTDASATDAGDASQRFCAAHADASLCYDFDDGKTVAQLFPDSIVSEMAASAIITSADAHSRPSALALGWPGGPFSNKNYLENIHTRPLLTPLASGFHFEVRLNLSSLSASPDVRVFTIQLTKDKDRVALDFNAKSGSTSFVRELIPGDAGASTFDVHTCVVPLAAWSLVEVDVSGSPPSAVVHIDGQLATTPIALDASTVSGASLDVQLTMQQYSSTSLPATTFLYDDLLVDVR